MRINSTPYAGGVPCRGQERAALLWFEAHARPRWTFRLWFVARVTLLLRCESPSFQVLR